MSEAALVSVIALLGYLLLVSRSGTLRNTPAKRRLILAAIWAGVFAAVALIFGSIL